MMRPRPSRGGGSLRRRVQDAARQVVALLGLALALVGCALARPDRSAPPFALTTQHGRPTSLADLRGQPVVLTFLYTACPDTCPAYLAAIAAGLRRIEAGGGQRPAIAVVTVDPDRDTVDHLRVFAGGWPADWLFLTGSYQDVAAVWRRYGIEVAKRPLPHSSEVHAGYSVVHTGKVVLIDREGRLSGELAGSWTAQELATRLGAMAERSGAAPVDPFAGLGAFWRRCGELAASQSGLVAGVLGLLLLPGLLLPVWLLWLVLGPRRSSVSSRERRR